MIKTLFGCFAVAILSFAALSLTGGKSVPPTADPTMSAAFRDGVYLGQREAQSGSKPNPLKSRWNSEEDRRSFAAGYYRGYMIEGVPTAATHWVPQPIDNQGFEVGKLDGMADRENARPFDLRSKVKSPTSACSDHGIRANSCQQFREAYVIGYQHGYYKVDASTAGSRHNGIDRPQYV
jgi:hypothetical protein